MSALAPGRCYDRDLVVATDTSGYPAVGGIRFHPVSTERELAARPALSLGEPLRQWSWPDDQGVIGPVKLFVLVAATYAVGSRLALLLIEASGLQSVFFIPAGLTVAFLLRLHRRWWWVVLVAAGVTEWVMDVGSGYAPSQSAGFAAANALEPLLGALIVTTTCGVVDLARRRHVLWFTLGAVLAGPALGALIGAWSDRFLGGDDFLETLVQWWIGDSLGVIVVGSAILVWGSSRDRRALWSPWGILLIVGTVSLTGAILTLSPLPLMFLVSVGVVLAGALFGVRAVSMTSLAVATTIAVLLTITSDWELLLIGQTPASVLLLLKIQLGVFALTGLLIAAESHERVLATRESTRLTAEAEALDLERMREHALAIKVQRGLLPDRLHRSPGLEVAARYEAAGKSLEVGGDWYDTFRLGPDRLGLVVGDIMGHGIEAMISMGRLRTAVAALAAQGDDPTVVLSQIDTFVGGPDGAGYATMFYAIVNRDEGSIRYASAGHPPALLISAEGNTAWLDKGHSGALTGATAQRSREGRIDFPAGSTLIMYTDGLIERRGEPLERGLDRLSDLAPQLVDLSSEEICDELVRRLRGGEEGRDDIVIMTVKREPSLDPIYYEVFPAHADELRKVRSSIRTWLEERDIPDSVCDDLLISIGEATANSVMHAYNGSPAGQFAVRLRLSGDALAVEVSDRGSWREPSGSSATPGFGLGIMRSTTESLQIRQTESGTSVSFIIPLDSEPQTV